MAGLSRAGSTSSLVILFLCFFSFSEAKDYLVGGKPDAWTVPSSQADSLNQWAQSSRFLVGDSLVWKFDGEKDSVLQVTKKDYVNCNTSSPIEEYKDGNTKVKLEQSGPYYFISGAEGHCAKGQKLIVVVISNKHRGIHSISPAPSPAEVEGPAVAPSSGATSFNGGFMVAVGALVGFVLV
ncbi:hypothetical protein RJ639_029292 [Escallonia herrerae]|uniref:Phytocyanin domain-containing protein n=1 Tax=Escallonia herrerae TaxID=1293975 RepID=A0AA88XA33_9ASTE|nr:hypothetical protein RJ639_029292 [Escallonia herrerae]